MSNMRLLAKLKADLADALAAGNPAAARTAFQRMLQAGKVWILEAREDPTPASLELLKRFTGALEGLDRTLRRNEAIEPFAPFLIGERVEVERVEHGPRVQWRDGLIIDYRPANTRDIRRPSMLRLDYLVRGDDGEESWHPEGAIRKKERA